VAGKAIPVGIGRYEEEQRQLSAQKLSTRQQERASLQARPLSVPPNRAADVREAAKRYKALTATPNDRGAVTCAWCGASVQVAERGRVPKWCSATCRHRAWEQRRAAESGLVAIEVVERPVEVVRTVTKVEQVLVDVPRPASPRSTGEWAAQLEDLADQLDRGRIYDRDVAALMPAMTALVAAFNRRHR